MFGTSHILTGMIVLAGCSIAAALAAAVPISAGGTRASEVVLPSGSRLEQRATFAPAHEPRLRRLAGTVVAPVGEGWG